MPTPGVLKQHKVEVIQMRESGAPIYKIAQHFGVAPFAVQEILRRHREAKAERTVAARTEPR